MSNVIDGFLGYVGELYSNISVGVDSYFPQVSQFLVDLPFVGKLLGNVSNSELTFVLVLGLLALYLRKATWIIQWFGIGVVIIVILVLFGVVNL